ncbi:MAG: ATP-binding protein [Asticcacaulis sp.]
MHGGGQGRPRDGGFYAQRLARAAALFAAVSLHFGLLGFRLLKRFALSLSGRLFVMTVGFLVIFEIVMLIPSLASSQQGWLNDRITRAEIASQAIDTSQKNTVSAGMSSQLLKSSGTLYLAILNNGVRSYRLYDPDVVVPDKIMDLRPKRGVQYDLAYLWAPWQTFLSRPGRLIHLEAAPRIRSGQLIEIVVPGDPLKAYLLGNLSHTVRISLMISLAAGILVFAALSFFIVRPIQRLTDEVQRFKTNPEDITITPRPRRRHDEIGQIEHELASMQEEVRHALRSRARLAALGQAVSKINHDLRNMLTSAQMASDRLAMSGDPQVAKALPRLERALDRALSLAQNVLTYGKSDEHAPQIQIVRLKDLAEASAEDAGLCLPGATGDGVRFTLRAPKSFSFEADPEQMYRLLVNLMRNARQAIELQPNRRTLGRVTLNAVKTSEHVLLIVADNGPGIPEKLREKLFQPFTSSSTPGGTGLGLAIAKELAQLHGGDVNLLQTGTDGTSFEIKLPLKG